MLNQFQTIQQYPLKNYSVPTTSKKSPKGPVRLHKVANIPKNGGSKGICSSGNSSIRKPASSSSSSKHKRQQFFSQQSMLCGTTFRGIAGLYAPEVCSQPGSQ